MIRSPTVRAKLGSATLRNITVNSSPPNRATVSPSFTQERSRWATMVNS